MFVEDGVSLRPIFAPAHGTNASSRVCCISNLLSSRASSWCSVGLPVNSSSTLEPSDTELGTTFGLLFALASLGAVKKEVVIRE